MTSTEALIQFASDEATSSDNFDLADVSPPVLRAQGAASLITEGINLQGRSIPGLSLRSANLREANLTGADLSRACCSGIILRGGRLEGTGFAAADLVGADLSSVDAGEADFHDALLEDANLSDAKLRFADFTGAILDGANFSRADLWGAKLRQVTADRVLFEGTRLDESSLADADLSGADFSGATLRRADLANAKLRNANLRDAVLDNAILAGADLRGALLPNVSLSTCNLRGVSFSGAWLDRTRMRASQLQDGVGEELGNDLDAALDSYIVLERNFQTLGSSEDARWAYLRRRRVGRKLHKRDFQKAFAHRSWRVAISPVAFWLADTSAEWLCDYGESLARVARAFLFILIMFAVVYWATGCLGPRTDAAIAHSWAPINYLLFSLNSMTTVGTSEIALRPRTEFGVLLSSLQTVMGTILLGLFGFVLGARIRS